MPLLETKGAASAQGFGGAGAGASGLVTYIEDVFSTWLYTGNGSTQTITNGIDLSGKGGLVWIKGRSGATDHALYDTTRGATKDLVSNSSAAETTQSTGLTAFNGTGFSIGALAKLNTSAATYVSWTFRKQPKFFDIVTYTGNGSNRTISHNLGSVPGCIIVKRTDTTGDWKMYHLGLTSAAYAINLNNNGSPEASEPTVWNSTAPTSTVFSVGTATSVNASGGTYVAYLFAHNAGGFGLSGSDNVISCGTYNGTGGVSATTVNLGFEPQFVFISNRTYGTYNLVYDSMRGIVTGGDDAMLNPSTSFAENGAFGNANLIDLNATGFTITASGYDVSDRAGSTYIYIAIRRGPMKVPTSGTSVFGLSARTGTDANATVTGSAGVSDAVLIKNRGSAVGDLFASRLTGTGYLETSSTAAEVAAGTTILQANPWDVMDGVKVGTTSTITNASANTYINYLFDRAPSFFDEVCYTGAGSATTVAHNLGVAPEMMIVKIRDGVGSWFVYQSTLGAATYATLNGLGSSQPSTAIWNNTAPTISVFSIGSVSSVNGSGSNYVAYLFASCAGVSKVGSYTGTGALQTINCGFTGGARFVLIKRTDSTGDWYVYDSARGISSGNDPYLLLNSTAAEVTGTNYVDTTSVGFQVTAAAPAGLNANGGTYIFLAIA